MKLTIYTADDLVRERERRELMVLMRVQGAIETWQECEGHARARARKELRAAIKYHREQMHFNAVFFEGAQP